jgi:hypothetical protein
MLSELALTIGAIAGVIGAFAGLVMACARAFVLISRELRAWRPRANSRRDRGA